MPWDEQEQRGRAGFFTVNVGGGPEHQLLGVSGLRRFVENDEYASSADIQFINLAGHLDVDNITIREAPIAGCLGEPVGQFLFDLLIAGEPVAHVRRISGLGVRWDTGPNRESDSLATQKLFHKRRYPAVTTELVVEWTKKWQLYDYVKLLGEFSGPGKAFSVVDGFTCDHVRDIMIVAKSSDGEESARWVLSRAWPMSYRISDMSSDSTDPLIVSVEWVVAPAGQAPGVTETIKKRLGTGQLVSGEFYDWVASAYDVPKRKDLMLNFYLPGLQPGVDSPVSRIKLFNCFPSEVTYGDFDASADGRLTREITVTFDGLLPM
ncbi:MAG: phage tail protein [Candidatus Thermoplasmatota archaeon]|nr:phage tail protein [Candidatus Thermoplasmatota archaeon]